MCETPISAGIQTLKSRVRTEYIHNILDSDYVLCVRGGGNFSFRFFEAMSLGRTPVLIDTDCVLPFDFVHDYKNLCVIVPEDKVHQVDQRVAEFHACFDDRTYRLHQERVRSFWVEWLSAEGFFRHLSEHWKALNLEPLEAVGGVAQVNGATLMRIRKRSDGRAGRTGDTLMSDARITLARDEIVAELRWEAIRLSRYLVDFEPSEALIERYLLANELLFRDPPTARDQAVLAFARKHPWSIPLLDAGTALSGGAPGSAGSCS